MLALTGVHHKAQLTVDQTSTSSVIINGCLVEFSVRLPHCDISNPKKLAAILTPTVRSPPLFSPTTSRKSHLTTSTSHLVICAVIAACVVPCFIFKGFRTKKAFKWACIVISMFFTIAGLVFSATTADDPDACVNPKSLSIIGTVLTGIGILLSAAASV
jgi:hypothetical protein